MNGIAYESGADVGQWRHVEVEDEVDQRSRHAGVENVEGLLHVVAVVLGRQFLHDISILELLIIWYYIVH